MFDNLKEIMMQEFDKDKNYNEIISKVEGMSNMKKLKIKYILAPAVTFIALFVIILGMNNTNTPNELIAEKNNTENNSKSEIKIALDINEMKDLEMMSSDADVKTTEISNLPENFTFINSIDIPDEYKIENSYNVYTRSSINTKEYDVLHDYVFSYRKDDTNDIKISFSEIGNPIRDYYIEGKNKISKIGETEVIIYHFNTEYIASFKYNDLYFDIETSGISQEELVNLLVSIIKQ